MVLGIRPEHVVAAEGAEVAFASPVQVIEALGNETLLYFEVAGQQLVVRAPGKLTPAVEESLGLALRAEFIHVFESGPEGRTLV